MNTIQQSVMNPIPFLIFILMCRIAPVAAQSVTVPEGSAANVSVDTATSLSTDIAMPASYTYTPTSDDLKNSTERIIDLHADIKICANGDIVITEYMTVYADGIEIKRGIVRNIPEYREDKDGKIKILPIDIRRVMHNGRESEYRMDVSYSRGKGKKERLIYTGSSDVFLQKGIHYYQFVYVTRGHIGFYDDYDELYWNVMGHDCAYLIERISATLHLPDNSKAIHWSCYTGEYGSAEQACVCSGLVDAGITEATTTDAGITDVTNEAKSAERAVVQEVASSSFGVCSLFFSVLRALQPGEGFTIAVAFPRDIIVRPTATDVFMEEHKNWISGIFCFSIVLFYVFFAWLISGRGGARKPTVIPQFSAPNGWSAEVVNYLYRRHFSQITFTAALIQMAVRGAVRIEYRKISHKKYSYSLIPTDKIDRLSNEQHEIFRNLFGTGQINKFGPVKLEITKERWRTFSDASDRLEKAVGKLFPTLSTFKSGYLKGYLILNAIIGFTHLALYDYDSRLLPLLIFPVMAILLMLKFMSMMEVMTPFGAQALSETEGLKMYITTAEKHWLDQLTPPEQTPEHFEEMLPYAVALGVENRWCKKFHAVLAKCNYSPLWYSSNDPTDVNRYDFRFVTEFKRSVSHTASYSSHSSTSTYSSSSSSSSGSSGWSSGSRGGGYSGGGGGGGGVKGW